MLTHLLHFGDGAAEELDVAVADAQLVLRQRLLRVVLRVEADEGVSCINR